MMDNNTAREIRKEFFAYRNGIIADKLRHAGDPHSMIMGCLLVDVTAIAQRTREALGDEARLQALAQELWADTNSRECRLAAPMLYPAPLILLDEPFKGLDAATRAAAIDFARPRLAGRTALLVTHDPEDAAAFGADRLALEPVP